MHAGRWIALAALVGTAAIILASRKSSYERALDKPDEAPSVFRSAEGRRRYETAYRAMLDRWPIAPQSINVPTRFGDTHIVAAGPADAKPLVLLHAVSVSATEWFRNVEALSRSFRLFAVDAVGDCGLTRTSCLPRDREGYAAWLEDVFEGLGLERAHLLGHSYGGFLAINYALRHPERVDRLVLLAPAASIYPFRPAIRFLLRRAGSIPFLRPSARATLRQMAHKGYTLAPEFVRLMEAVVADCTPLTMFPEVFDDEELRRLRMPTLLLLGDEERIYDPFRALRRARRLIPNLDMAMIPRAGHLLNMEQPEAVNAAIIEFLNGRSAGSEFHSAR